MLAEQRSNKIQTYIIVYFTKERTVELLMPKGVTNKCQRPKTGVSNQVGAQSTRKLQRCSIDDHATGRSRKGSGRPVCIPLLIRYDGRSR